MLANDGCTLENCRIVVPGGEALPKPKREVVSVSFHYLGKKLRQSDGSFLDGPISPTEFDALFEALKNKPAIDPNIPEQADRLRYRLDVPIDHIERLDNRTVFGTFRAAYWGHAYNNTAKGRIPPESISLRPFHFMLYLGKSGRLYLGAQYLGQFGGYGALERTVRDRLPGNDPIIASSFRLSAPTLGNAQAREVRVSFSDRSSSIAKANAFGSSGVVVFKKQGADDGFEDEVSSALGPALGKSSSELKKAIAMLASQSELIDVQDADIDECTIVAIVDGRRKTINVLDAANFSTKFPIEVGVDSDGHPLREPVKAAMLDLLEKQIISRKENV